MEMLFNNSAAFQFLSFRASEEWFGIDVEDVKEIVRFKKLIPIPDGPSFIEGLVTLRGMVVPVIDLGKRLSTRDSRELPERAIIVEVDSHVVGFIVDEISDIVAVRRDEIIRPKRKKGEKTGHLKGVVKLPRSTFALIDPDALLTAEEKKFLSTPIRLSGLETHGESY